MAKPGSDDARRINGKVHDLSAAAMSDERAQELQEKLELGLGQRCAGCGRRITIGFQFSSYDVRDTSRPVMHVAACSRDDCGFAERSRDGATVMKVVEFVWLDLNGPDAPASPHAQFYGDHDIEQAERGAHNTWGPAGEGSDEAESASAGD